VRNRTQRSSVHIAIRHWTLVALQHQRVGCRFSNVQARAGGPFCSTSRCTRIPLCNTRRNLALAVFFSGPVKTRCLEPNLERLPLTGTPAGIYARRCSAYAFVVDPALVNCAAIKVFRMFHAVAIVNLYFVKAVQIHAGIGLGGNQELQVELHIAKPVLGDDVRHRAFRPIDEAIPHAG